MRLRKRKVNVAVCLLHCSISASQSDQTKPNQTKQIDKTTPHRKLACKVFCCNSHLLSRHPTLRIICNVALMKCFLSLSLSGWNKLRLALRNSSRETNFDWQPRRGRGREIARFGRFFLSSQLSIRVLDSPFEIAPNRK